ncbi:GNAT family N-acetyltransferase [Dactylosporangium matsuzakiense]|uniref:GNAT family N-acetyltransferase n=1 Tax=Dactylosporangium matsuzakiense TaxID=53360 RepID=UPI0021C2FF41|nr:GNAT family N-acetyltransferase [Dactylosporangium matsuzakiense]UWZ41782.1 GNAT family N-acetyltransferase [Dactylosporangium matsuzakiense]
MRIVHTADLTAAERAEVRILIDTAYRPGFTDADWSHALGGLHVLAEAGGRIVGHAAVVQRSLLIDGVPHRGGYLEAVAVHPDHQRLGYAAALLDEAERIIRAGYDLGALSAGPAGAGLYTRRGWTRWPGTTAVLTPRGLTATPGDDRNTYVLPVAGGPLAGASDSSVLACDFRIGDAW